MSTHKHIDRICCIILAAVLFLTVVFVNAEKLGVRQVKADTGYDARLFDTSLVHTIDIQMEDWDNFVDSCENEEYALCSVVIDDESFSNIGIRAKGNTSLSSVSAYGNDRYSFKLEFDHYTEGENYYGLDKLNLNNIIQDNTYMKDYLTYRMMGTFGVKTPLCSYVYITVNGEDFGLYLAVEGMEESFLERNYGNDYGELYKPDSISMGGGRGNGNNFDMKDKLDILNGKETDGSESKEGEKSEAAGDIEGSPPDFGNIPEGGNMPDMSEPPNMENMPDMEAFFEEGIAFGKGGMDEGGMSMGGDDVSLVYTDDAYESYSNIFDNAKTEITDTDKERLIASLKQLNEGSNVEDVVNIEEVIRYFVVHNFVCNFDSYTGTIIHNYYLYEENGEMSMIPWDYNLAFGGFMSASDATTLFNYPIDSPVSGGSTDSRPMLSWIFNDESYTELYHQYFAEFLSAYFDNGYFEEMMEKTVALITPYVEKDPTKFCTFEEFQEGVSTLEEFCLLRAESVGGQLDGTIPSTSEALELDSKELIEAESVAVSAMGSMGSGMGGGFMGGKEDKEEGGSETEGNSENQRKPDMFGAGTSMAGTSMGTETWVLLGVSFTVLLAGLFTAFKYKR